jgi:hypothetical protein
MRRYVSGMAYQNYFDPELADWRHAYYGSNYPRLVAIRRRVDPEHRFNFPQAIGRLCPSQRAGATSRPV